MMWRKWMLSRRKRKLKDPAYAWLFEPYEGDEYVAFDTETTGMDPKKAEILTIGAVKIRGNRILSGESFHLSLKPQGTIDEAAIRVHHIRNCDMKEALDPREGIRRFVEFIGNRPLVGYYLEFDMAMVNKYIKAWLGVSLPNRLIEVSGIYFDQRIGRIPQGNIDLRFDTILEQLKLPMFGKHNALNDAIMTAMIFVRLTYLKTPKENA